MKKRFLKMLQTLLVLCIIILGFLFFFQEKLLFFPQKLDNDYQFSFEQEFEELNITAQDGKILNGLLFKAVNSKGLIFYLHGNAGSLSSWGEVAETYTDLNYDVFMLDYRGYGKSEGKISSQNQLFEDVQITYDQMLKKYDEDSIVVLGYSIGTGPAIKIASTNKPKLLILQAPFFNLTDLMRRAFPIVPTFILKYKFKNDELIKDCKMPIVIFHGDQDEVIYYNSSVKLKEIIKRTDKLITLEGQGHNGMTSNPDYLAEIRKILN